MNRTIKKVTASTAVSLLSAAGALCATATPATATPASASNGCPVNAFYALTSSNVRIPFKNLATFRDGPGGTLSVTKNFTRSVSYVVTAGAEAEVSGVFASAKVTVSASLTKGTSTTVTNNYTHKIPAHKYGNVRYVSYGKKITYKKQIFSDGCKIKTLASGSINFPTNTEGWHYWTTTH